MSANMLDGFYIEGQTGTSLGLVFDSHGCSMYMDLVVTNKESRQFTGITLCQGIKATIVGDTVRMEGGTLTTEGKILTLFSPPGGGNVSLLTVTDNGQSLEYKRADGSVMKFIKQ